MESNEPERAARRQATWSAWYEDVLACSALAPSLCERARRLLDSFTPDAAAAVTLSEAYSTRSMRCARAALRAALLVSGHAVPEASDACVLVASELMELETREQADTVSSLEHVGVDADAVIWKDDVPMLREDDGVLETRQLVAALIELPAVRREVRELGLDAMDGDTDSNFQRELRHLWAVIEGRAVKTTPDRPTEDALTSLADEMRALREEVARRASPYQGGDWVADIVSSLPPLLDQGEAAKALGVDPRTVRRMIRRGDLKAVDVGEGGRGRSCGVRIPRGTIADFLRGKAKHP